MKLSQSPSDRDKQLAVINAERLARGIAYAAKIFKLDPKEVIGHNSGSCYDKVWVNNRAAAEKVASCVKGQTCNGGYFDGMSLGGITEAPRGVFEVMC